MVFGGEALGGESCRLPESAYILKLFFAPYRCLVGLYSVFFDLANRPAAVPRGSSHRASPTRSASDLPGARTPTCAFRWLYSCHPGEQSDTSNHPQPCFPFDCFVTLLAYGGISCTYSPHKKILLTSYLKRIPFRSSPTVVFSSSISLVCSPPKAGEYLLQTN